MNWWPHWFLAVLMVFVCVLLIIIVLLQRGRGGGLAGAFGGAGGSSAFGAKTGDVLTWITVAVAGVFLSLNVALNFAFDKSPIPPQGPAITTGLADPITVPGPDGQPITVTPIEIPAQPAGEGGAGTAGSEDKQPAATPEGSAPAGQEGNVDSGAGDDSTKPTTDAPDADPQSQKPPKDPPQP